MGSPPLGARLCGEKGQREGPRPGGPNRGSGCERLRRAVGARRWPRRALGQETVYEEKKPSTFRFFSLTVFGVEARVCCWVSVAWWGVGWLVRGGPRRRGGCGVAGRVLGQPPKLLL